MIEKRCNYAVLSMGGKMFVIAGDETTNCEIFDSFSRKFTKINSKLKNLIQKESFYMHLALEIILLYCKNFQITQKQLFTYTMLVNENGQISNVILQKT